MNLPELNCHNLPDASKTRPYAHPHQQDYVGGFFLTHSRIHMDSID
jgi:hypothetical protein